MLYKANAVSTRHVKAGPDDGLKDGEFIVYPSTFTRTPDSHGDVVAKGAFAESIRAWKEKGHSLPGLYGHRMDDPDFFVAHATDMGEDDHGWWVRGEFDMESEKARQVYRLVKGRRLNQLSFAYDIQDSAIVVLEGKEVQELRRLHVHEFSFVPVGSNQDTSVVAVKTAPVEDAEQASTPVTESAREDESAKGTASDEEPDSAKSPVESDEPMKSVPVERVAAQLKINALSGQKGVADMATLTEQRAALIADAQKIVDGAKAAERDLTAEENELIESKLKAVDEVDEKAAQHKRSADLVSRLTGYGTGDEDSVESTPERKAKGEPAGATIGERFAKSPAIQGLRKTYGENLRDTKNPIHVEAYNLGGIADLGIGKKASTITTATSQQPGLTLPGYRSELVDEPLTFLDLITTGQTTASLLEYAQVVSTEDNAAIVAEGELKPISDLATAKATAKAHVYADGFEVTNQVLADDGALVAFMDSRIRRNVRGVIESTIINGDATNSISGILNTEGVQEQEFEESVIVSIARALEKLEAVGASASAIVMNPADAWKLSLTKESGVGYLVGNPLQQGLNPSPFGVRLVKSNKVAAGTALVGNFSGVQFLEREGLSVVAFNQHKDFAQRNMSYVRAECRGLQLIQAPREIVNVSLAAAGV